MTGIRTFLLKCCLVLIFGILGSYSGDPFSKQPRIAVQNGHMTIYSALNKNVSLSATGLGTVQINNIDVKRKLSTEQGSGDSTLQRTAQLTQTLRIQQFSLLYNNLLSQVNQLEANVTNITQRMNRFVGSGSGRLTNRKLNGLLSKISGLETKVNSLTTRLNQDDCSSNPCRNGGTCFDMYNGYMCKCPSNWEGPTCESDVNECARYSGTGLGCQNGATCVNLQGSYRCDCPSNWHGIHCTQQHDDCSSASSFELCGHGTCINEKRVQPGMPKYTCICDEGWTNTPTNPACIQDVDECQGTQSKCSKNPLVQCYNIPGSFHCGPCPAGYTGNGFWCADINECEYNNGGCSMNPRVECYNTLGSRRCGPCPNGYFGNGEQCMYQSACNNNRGGCHPLATCIDNPAISVTYRECRCPPGYVGTGEGINGCVQGEGMSCANNPCEHGTCQMVGQSYHCACSPGYYGTHCELQQNICFSQPCQNGGTCAPNGGTFTCTCPEGYTGATCAEPKQRCGGHKMENNGTLRYPENRLYYDHEESCGWVITVDEGKVVNITFDHFHLEQAFDCEHDFLQLNDGPNAGARVIGRFCSDQLHGETYTSTHNSVYLWFRSDRSVAGTGFSLKWEAVPPVCGGILSEAEYGSIKSPGYPGKYPKNRTCSWLVQVPVGKRIKFIFPVLHLEHHENCSYDYVKIFDGASETDPEIGSFCTTAPTTSTLETSGHTATVLFHSDDSVQDDGFSIVYVAEPGVEGCGGTKTTPQGKISSPEFPYAYPHNLFCEWIIRIHPDNRIKMTFTDFRLEYHGNCSYDYVEIYDGQTDASPLLGRYCGENVPHDIISNTNYVYVRFRSDMSQHYRGFMMEYKTICGGIYTDLTGLLTSPYYPDPYPANALCLYEIILAPGYLINLTITNIGIEPHRLCNFDFLEIRDGNTETSPLLASLCGYTAPESIVSSFNQLWMKFVTDGSVQNQGFSAQYEAIDVGCGGLMTENNGVISSPRHPETYPHSATCTWLIRAPEAHIIRLTFTTFILEQDLNCNYDYVLLEDTNGVVIGKKFCGITKPPVITTLDNTLIVKFVTDASVSRDGFTATYTFLDASEGCGGDYYHQSGVITSPGYPNHYPHSAHCIWTIYGESNRQITLNVTRFNTEHHTDCRYDFLEIRNGGYGTSPLIGKYCGDQILPIIRSHSNVMRLEFKSDASMTAPGFEIQFDSSTTGCGGVLTDVRGSIISPNYPQPYPFNADCEWSIRVSEGSVISLSIVEIDIEEHSTCLYDYLQIFDGDSERSKSLLRICNNQQNPGHLVSSSNEVLLRFRSDASEEAGGFHLVYQTLCNTVLTKRQGVIESPNFPNPYPHNHNCSWIIQSPPGSNISIAFSHLFIEGHETCDLDYVEVLEKRENENVQLGKFCGDMARPPKTIQTSTNTAIVRLITDRSVTSEGFRLEYSTIGCGGDIYDKPYGEITSPNYPAGYPRDTVCYWHIWYPPGNRVELTLEDVDIETHPDCAFDFIRVYGGEDVNAPQLANVCSGVTDKLVYTSNGNHLFIHFHSDVSVMKRGFKATFSKIAGGGCGGRYTLDDAAIMSPNHPDPYNNSDECDWLIEVSKTHLVNLQFYEFEMPAAVNCSFGYVAIYDGNNVSAPLLMKHCGEKPEGFINSTSNQMLVKLVSDGIHVAKGFKAHYMTGCGSRLLADDGGEIRSPQYPHMPKAAGCSWIIYASDMGEKVSLTMTHLHFPDYDNCSYSRLLVYDGDMEDSPLIGQYCGTRVPPPIVSRGSILRVVLDKIGIFRAVYGMLSEHCGGAHTAASGSFASPGYPNYYDMEMECIWTIEASAGNNIQLSFQSFELEDSEFCNTDYVEIHENDPSGRLIGKYCGNRIPSNMTAAHKLWIKFRSDDIGTSPGFMAHYELVHGTVHNGTSGDIASPAYPHKYHTEGTFEWTIIVPSDMVVSIQFTQIEIMTVGRSEACYSAVKIFDGSSEEAPLLGEYCGYQVPDPVTSTGSVVTVQFVSESYYSALFYLHWTAANESGFIANVGDACFVEYMVLPNATNTTIVTSPNYPNYYYDNMNCTYLIRTLNTHHINMEFTDFEFEDSRPSCFFDKVETYTAPNSNVDSWDLNSTYCGTMTPFTIFSQNNVLKLVLTSDSHVTRKGFSAQVTSECGGQIFGTDGVLHSSSIYPHVKDITRYQSFRCEWVITVKQRRTIQLHFEQFDVQSDNVCSNTYISIKNGATSSSPALGNGKYCGTNAPQLPQTSSNNVFVQVVYSASSGGVPVFSLRYEMVQTGCGGHVHLYSGYPSHEISSPNFPNPPNHDIECEWIIMSPHGTSIRIDFDPNFGIGPNCYDGEHIEYLDLYDGGTENAERIKRLCGTEYPSSVLTTNNALLARYLTSLEEPNKGFKATIKIAQCGGTISEFRHVISSPNYPQNYGSAIECEWFLKMKYGYHVTLTVTDFETPVSSQNNCSTTDYLEIRDTDSKGTLLRTLCGTPVPLPIVIDVPGPFAYVKFKSDSAHTAKGFTMTMEANREEGCGANLFEPYGVITSPRYPNALPAVRECFWSIHAPEGRAVKIEFEEMNLPKDENLDICISYVTVLNLTHRFRERHANYTHRYCGSTLPAPINSYTSSLYVHLTTIGLNAGQGFRLRYSTEEEAMCGAVLPGPSGVIATPEFPVSEDTLIDCRWKIEGDPNKTIAFRFRYLEIPGLVSDFCKDGALILRGGTGTVYWGGVYCGNHTNGLVITSPMAPAKIRLIASLAHPFRGFTGTYNSSDCGGFVDAANAVITSPGYPNNYPPGIDCHWIVEAQEGDIIQLTTIDMRLEETCTQDYVTVFNGFHRDSPQVGKFCGTHVPMPIVSSGRFLTVIFHSDDYGTAPGFKMTTTDVQIGCGGIIHMFHGNFSSPKYPSRYDSNVECIWTIEYPGGYLVKIEFEGRFDIEMDNTCSKDYLKFEDVESNGRWTLRDKKCGSSLPSSFISKANKLRVTFHSNEHVSGDGFNLKYSAVCGGNFTNDRGEIRSPNYPDMYENNLLCKYVIGKPGDYIRLTFDEHFSIEKFNFCRYDFLEIFQQEENENSSQGQFCGDVPPAPRSLQGPVILKFKTDSHYKAYGFKVTYQLVNCNRVLTEPSGIIESPPVSDYYSQNLDCSWQIIAPEDKVVVIRFHFMNISTTYYCSRSYVEIIDGNSTGRAIGRYCSSSAPNVKSKSNQMLVRFHHDLSTMQGEFKLVYFHTYGEAHGCGGNLNSTSGEIQSLDIDSDGNYEPNLDCGWYILVNTQNQAVNITFTKFDLEASTNGTCLSDYLELREGGTNGPVIGLYCGSSVPQPTVTTANRVFVHFHSDGVNNKPGFKLNYRLVPSPCGASSLNATSTAQNLTSPNYPNPYPTNLRCTWVIASAVRISGGNWYNKPVEITMNDFDVPCGGDYLEYKSGDHHRYSISNKDCGTSYHRNEIIKGGGEITFNSDTINNGAKGFSLTFKEYSCNQTFKADGGVISSGHSTVSGRCLINITVSEGKTVSLYFDDIYTGNDCNTNYMEVFDGPNTSSPMIAKLCGYQLQNPLFSSGSSLFIDMHLPQGYAFYNMIYMATDKGRGCGGSIVAREGTITSPLYPVPYNNTGECTWHIGVSQNHAVRIDFLNFGLNPSNCNANYLELYDGPSDDISARIARYCGNDTPGHTLSNTNKITVKLVTDSTNDQPGFFLAFYADQSFGEPAAKFAEPGAYRDDSFDYY